MTDTIEIRFALDEVLIDMEFDGNQQRWDNFERNFMQRFGHMNPLGVTIDIYSGASPEGNIEHNRWLGQERGESIRRLIEQRLRGRVGYIVIHNESARWQALYDAVEASAETWRDEVLSIIRQPASVNENGRDRREWLLRHTLGDEVWEKLLSTYLPPLRSGASAIVSWCPENLPSRRDTLVVIDTVYVVQPVVTRLDASDTELIETIVQKPVIRKPVWIMRTNLPLLAVGTPNLQLEWSLDRRDRWSFNIEGAWSWWTFAHNGYANQFIYGSMELRHWLGRRWRHNTLEGWHLGIGVAAGYGDVEWRSRGYQAELYSGFLNIGWHGRFGRYKQWALDAGIGLGLAHIPWRRYQGSSIFPEGREEQYDDHLMWRETSRTNWIGTPHINISIGYVFPQRDAQWKRNKAVQRHQERNSYKHFRDSVMAHEKFHRDSIRTAMKQWKQEISVLPKADRQTGYQQFYAAQKQAKADKKEARKQQKLQKKEQKEKEKLTRQQQRNQHRLDKEVRKAQQQEMREWNATTEGRAALQQQRAEDKAAKQQAKTEAKAAKKQAKQQRKLEKIRSRMEAEQQRHQQRLQRDMQQNDQKYNKVK